MPIASAPQERVDLVLKDQISKPPIEAHCGWETRAMFDRSNTIDVADLAAAVAKRFSNGSKRRTATLPRPPRIL